jgi:hypothetical protein
MTTEKVVMAAQVVVEHPFEMSTLARSVESLLSAVVVQVFETAETEQVTVVLAYMYPVAVGNDIMNTAPLGKIVALVKLNV